MGTSRNHLRRIMSCTTVSLTVCVFLATLLVSSPAVAAPKLTVELTRTSEPMPRSEEWIGYTAKVNNTAPANPVVGAAFACNGAPAEWGGTMTWFGAPAGKLTFKYQWLRDGEAIPGANGTIPRGGPLPTYTVVSEDEGKTIQCLVTATVEATNPAESMSSSAVSLPPVVVVPEPSPEPPTVLPTVEVSRQLPTISTVETTKRLCTPPVGWVTTASGNLASGSPTVTSVDTASGKGITANNSAEVTSLVVEGGAYKVGQTITMTGVTFESGASTTITKVTETTLTLASPVKTGGGTGTDKARRIVAGSQPFAVGQTIVGPGIPAGTTITAINGQTITISANATASATGAVIYSPNIGEWSYQWLRNGAPIPGATSATYEPSESGADKGTLLQCEATNKTGTGEAPSGGKAVTISSEDEIGTYPAGIETVPSTSRSPEAASADATNGKVTLELELPLGEEVEVTSITAPGITGSFANSGWTCTVSKASGSVHARVTCTRSNTLAPEASYPPILVGVGVTVGESELGEEALATVSGGGSAAASDTDLFEWEPAIPFGLQLFTTEVSDQNGASYTQAGGHPTSAGETFTFNSHHNFRGAVVATGHVRNANTELPAGFIGNALATPELCQTTEEAFSNDCPLGSMVGGISLHFPNNETALNVPIYSLVPEYGEPAQFAFGVEGGGVYVFSPELRPGEGYAINLDPAPIVKAPEVLSVHATLCSFGAKRVGIGTTVLASGEGETYGARFAGCRNAGEAGASKIPLITNPTRCAGAPPTTRLSVDSWEHPEDVISENYANPALTGCESVPFQPRLSLQPTSGRADSPTGMNVELTMPAEGLESPTGISQADLDNVTVRFPEGVSLNPSAADGLGSCTPQEVKMGSNDEAQCPESSKVGTVEVTTPLLRKTLTGDVYLASQNDNPFKSTLGLYLVFASKQEGITIKVAGKLVPNPVTGQLTAEFVENPQDPFSKLVLHFNEGPRAPLINSPSCGTYTIHSELSPWSAADPEDPAAGEVVSQDSTDQVSEGPGGGACPSGSLEPKLTAGLQSTAAGSTSPLVLSVSREDGSQRFTGLDLTMPLGLTADLTGVPFCPDAVLASISEAEGSGQGQIEHPSCPAASQIGTVEVGVGAGPDPLYVKTGKAYLVVLW